MSRAPARYRDHTPICVECGRMKTRNDGPWMRHPVDYGWWCGCEVPDDYQACTHSIASPNACDLCRPYEESA